MTTRLFLVFALALAIGLGTAVSPYASSAPDGLNRVAEDHAFGDRGKQRSGPIGGYAFPGVGNEKLAKGLAGFAGTLGVFAVGFGIATVARRRPHERLA
jgi:hypothetical protein